MVSAVIIATCIVIWVVGFLGLFLWIGDEAHWINVGALVLWVVLGLSAAIYSSSKEEEQGPCLKEATRFTYDPGTKTTRPYTYCAERGKWSE